MRGLKGKLIINTSAQSKAEKLKILLTKKEAEVINFPLISIQANIDNSQTIKQTLNSLSTYTWLVFTSTNGVKYFDYWVKHFQIDTKNLPCKYAAIGTSTGMALMELGYSAKFISNSKDSVEYGEELLTAFVGDNQKILVPAGNLASTSLQNVLNKEQHCEYLIVYNTINNSEFEAELSTIVQSNKYDLILFLSPSAVNSFVIQNRLTNLAEVKAVAIGKTTEKAMVEKGINPVLTASTPNANIMVTEIDEYFK